MSRDTESLRNLAAAQVGRWLTAVVDALLAEPGGLYNPVFIGPVAELGGLIEAVSAAAAVRAVPVGRGAEPPAAGVWLVSIAGAEDALDAGWTPRPGVQWLVWGDGPVSTLPDRTAGWVGAKGLALDPLAGAADSSAAWSFGPAVAAARAAGEERGTRSFVVVSGEAGDLPALGAELQLHLELEVGGPIWRGRAEGWNERDATADARVLLVTSISDVGAICRRIEELGPGSPWGVVVERVAAERMRLLPRWTSLAERTWWISRCASDVVGRERVFPPIVPLLVGSDGITPDREEVMQFTLGAVSLLEILQAAEGWARSGTLVVFEAERLGWIRVGHGCVSAVGLLKGGEEATSEERVYQLLAAMAARRDATAVFVPGESAARGVPIGRAVMAVAHAAGESTPACGTAPAALRVHEVARALVGWGLPDVARGLLERAEQALAWGAEEDVLLGKLSAGHNPDAAAARLRHGAMRAFAEERAGAGVSVYFDAMLNALLLEVRAGRTPPSVAWSIVDGWLREAGTEWAATARHAAICMELAVRAGAYPAARQAQACLRGHVPGLGAELLPLLDVEIGDEQEGVHA